MPRVYSTDLRTRVIAAVAAGASRREAAERFEVSASSAVRWLQRWRDEGSVHAKPFRESRSPLEDHVDWLKRGWLRSKGAGVEPHRDGRALA